MNFTAACQSLIDGYVAQYRAGDAAGCAAIYHEHATLYSAFAPPAQGRTAIGALHRDWLAEETETKAITVVDASYYGDLGWCVAQFQEEGGGGTSLNVMQNTPETGWLILQSSLTEL